MEYHPNLDDKSDEFPNLNCVRRVLKYFHANFLYFGSAFLFPVVVAYGVHNAADKLARSAMKHVLYPGDTLPYRELAIGGMLRWGGYALVVVVFGLAVAGTTIAVGEIRRGNDRPPFEVALQRPRARLWAIAGSALLQFIGLMLSSVLSTFLAGSFIIKTGLPTKFILWLGWTLLALCLAIFSRWMLSVPILIEENCGVFASLRRSQHLTAHYTPAMLVFVAHAAVGGYIAGIVPYYLFNLVARRNTLPSWSGWVPFALSFLFVAWTEPIYAIGCAETYYAAQERERQEEIPRSIEVT